MFNNNTYLDDNYLGKIKIKNLSNNKNQIKCGLCFHFEYTSLPLLFYIRNSIRINPLELYPRCT